MCQDDEKRPGIRRKRKINKKKMSNYFTEYCSSTSIHGFRYLGEQDRSCLEKFWWLLTIMVSLIVCIFLIIQTYKKWIRSPVIVTFATKQTPIWQIPFPAVTVCPETKALTSKFNIPEEYKHLVNQDGYVDDKTKNDFEKISLICPINIGSTKTIKFKTNFTDKSAIDFIKDVGPSMDEIFRKCQWRGKKVNCEDYFTPILTDEGICYTFNMLDRSEIYKENVWQYEDFLTANESSTWNIEDGYGSDISKNSYPRRALYSGAKAGLDLEFEQKDKDLSYACGEALQGFKILLHSPEALPRVSEQYFRLPLNQAVVASIKPEIMATSPVLQNYYPSERLCYFANERKLTYFKSYTQLNCETECLANFTLTKCGCVDFHMPKLLETPICGAAKLSCMQKAESTLLSDVVDAKIKREEEEQLLRKNPNATSGVFDQITTTFDINLLKKKPSYREDSRDCNCLPSCQSLAYSVETSQTDWKWYKQYTDIKFGVDLKNKTFETKDFKLAKILIFFKDNQFVSSERDELYNGADFLANCGGLLGLFTGFSFISLVEIIYFLSLRFICNIRLYGRKNWSGSVKQ